MTFEEKILAAKTNDMFSEISEVDKKYDDLIVKISSQILKERHKRKMTQKQFADYLGVTQTLVSKWESAEYNFSLKKAVELLNKLDIKMDIAFSSKNEYSNMIEGSFQRWNNLDKSYRYLSAEFCGKATAEGA